MQKRKPGRSRKLTPDDANVIVEWVSTHGMISGSTSTLDLSIDTVIRRITPHSPTYDPAFHARIKQAYLDYKKTRQHPADDPEVRGDLIKQFKLQCKTGASLEQMTEYDTHGRVVRRVTRRPDVKQWMFEAVFPPRPFVESAIITICANQFDDLRVYPFESEHDRDLAMGWLSNWMRRAQDELQKQGLSVKVLSDITNEQPEAEATP